MEENVTDAVREVGKLLGRMGAGELKLVGQLLNRRREIVAGAKRREFRFGDRVWFESKGYVWTGQVSSIGPKNIMVKARRSNYLGDPHQNWRVHPNLLNHELSAQDVSGTLIEG